MQHECSNSKSYFKLIYLKILQVIEIETLTWGWIVMKWFYEKYQAPPFSVISHKHFN